MSNAVDTVNKVKGFESGGADYIDKFDSPEEIIARINAHIELHRLRRKITKQNKLLQNEIQRKGIVQRELNAVHKQIENALKISESKARFFLSKPSDRYRYERTRWTD